MPIKNKKLNNQFYFAGNKSLLKKSPVAVFCSQEIPLSIYHTANETFSEMIKLPITIAGGWQSAMEKRVLKNFDGEGQANIIYFLAKGINRFSLPVHLTSLMDKGKILIISPFSDKRRIEKESVKARDKLIFAFINKFLFLYIKPDGYLEGIFRQCINEGKDVYVLEHAANSGCFIDGVKPLNQGNLKGVLIG